MQIPLQSRLPTSLACPLPPLRHEPICGWARETVLVCGDYFYHHPSFWGIQVLNPARLFALWYQGNSTVRDRLWKVEGIALGDCLKSFWPWAGQSKKGNVKWGGSCGSVPAGNKRTGVLLRSDPVDLHSQAYLWLERFCWHESSVESEPMSLTASFAEPPTSELPFLPFHWTSKAISSLHSWLHLIGLECNHQFTCHWTVSQLSPHWTVSVKAISLLYLWPLLMEQWEEKCR